MSAEDKMKRKSQVTLKFMIYGVGILVVLLIVALLAFFGIFEKDKPQQDVIVDSELELSEICNKLAVNNEVYPFLDVMGNGLKKENGAEFIAYKFPAELRSDLDIFNVDKLILCGVPAELCYTENNDIKGGTYCILMKLEVPIFIEDFNNWYANITKSKNGIHTN